VRLVRAWGDNVTMPWRYIEPIEAGRIVLGGIRANRAFIFTHPEDLKQIEAQYAEITSAFHALSK